ncbi:hypothetical protein GCM10023215_29640 [Pseudonocardia yuanmonensis]|uniref:Aldehyde dehydrogenase domain-containing protein n=1 Tax=Pseudonocardia yuanmonensis TaxID=1095914 RepID=A0ABP8WK27_9PSEU
MSETTLLDRPRFFIDGGWCEPEGTERHVALDAATEEVIGTAALGSPADIAAAARAARAALDDGPWSRTTGAERAAAMRRVAAALEARGAATAELVSRENGMPIGLSRLTDVGLPVNALRYYADLTEALPLEEVRPSANGATLVRREPVGVVGAITPWNYPQALAMDKIAPALAAGCTVVLKPSPETALDSYIFAEAAMEAELPPGVLNVVLASREASAALVSSPDVDKIAFTGSTAAGRVIGAECGRLIRRCTLELGGRSAAIVLDDADLDVLVGGLTGAAFRNNAQTCTTQAASSPRGIATARWWRRSPSSPAPRSSATRSTRPRPADRWRRRRT